MKFIYLLLLPLSLGLAAGCTPAGASSVSSVHLQKEMAEIKNGLAPAFLAHKGIRSLKDGRAEAGFEDYLNRVQEELKREPGYVLAVRPTSGRLSSRFGSRRLKFEKRARQHNGIDLAAPKGTPIKAAGAGRVLSADWRGAYGRVVEIDHGEGLTTIYAHMDKYIVKKGQAVVAGQNIGQVGNTGRSTGPHLHFEVRVNNIPIDPLKFLKWA